jgi:potassium/hydrogen antiporter
LNDPMAVILTVGVTHTLLGNEPLGAMLIVDVLRELAIGAVVGGVIGYGAGKLLQLVALPAAGLYPVMTLATAFLGFGVPTALHGSGFLGVYVAGIMLGRSEIRYRGGVLRVHDALAWLAQITMFLMLGLLAFPSRLLSVAQIGLLLALFLAVCARPIAALICLLPFRFRLIEIVYVGWVGLRGAVPVILATFPILMGVADAHEIFDVVFFIVVVNALIPGSTVKWLTRKTGQFSNAPPAPDAVLEIVSTQPMKGQFVSFFINKASAACGAALVDLPFPPTTTAALIVRGQELIAPRGNTVLSEGDHVYVFSTPEDVPLLFLIFGQPEEDH